MSSSHRFLAGLIFFGILTPGFAKDGVAEWIGKLSSRNYVERERAARALEQLGAAALPHLDKLTSHADLETKRRAELISGRIEERLLQEEFAKASTLRLCLKNMSLENALREVEKQSGLLCGDAREPERVIEVETGAVPYWQAWRHFCRVAALEESDFTVGSAKIKPLSAKGVSELTEMLNRRDFDMPLKFHAPRLEFAPPAQKNPRFAVDDRHSIRVRVKWLEVVPFGAGKPHAVFAVELRGEPRLNIVGMPKVEITKVVEADGRAHEVQALHLLPEDLAISEHADFLAAFAGEVQYGGLLHMRAVPWPYPKLTVKELHGRVLVQTSGRLRMMEMKNVLEAAGKEMRGKQGITVKVLQAKKTDLGDIELRLLLDHLDSLAPKTLEAQVVRVRPGVLAMRGPADIALERLCLLDRNGRMYQRTVRGYHEVKEGKGYEADLVFRSEEMEADAPVLVMMEDWRTVRVQMPFAVRDVAAP